MDLKIELVRIIRIVKQTLNSHPSRNLAFRLTLNLKKKMKRKAKAKAKGNGT